MNCSAIGSWILLLFGTVLTACGAAPLTPPGLAPEAQAQSIAAAGEMLDAWHRAAANADEEGYFSHFAPEGVFLGTDATERWDVASFRAYAHPHFERGRAWTFRAASRAVMLEAGGQLAYFDEELETEGLGPARGSGVLRRDGAGAWKILHYNLTITVPNERFAEVHALLAAQGPGAETPGDEPASPGAPASVADGLRPVAPAPQAVPTPQIAPAPQIAPDPPTPPAAPGAACPQLPPAVVPPNRRRGHRVVITVRDYRSLDPVPGVRVRLSHAQTCTRNGGCRPTHDHPARQLALEGVTNARGELSLSTPDLNYGYYVPEHNVPGYLNFSSHYNLGRQRCHALAIERRSRDGRTLAFDLYLVPERVLAVRTREEAIAAAHQNSELSAWRRGHADAVLTVRGGGSAWQVGYGYGDRLKRLVRINAFDGTTAVIGRWN